MRLLRRPAPLLLTVLLLSSCGALAACDGPGSAGSDAGSDAGAREGRPGGAGHRSSAGAGTGTSSTGSDPSPTEPAGGSTASSASTDNATVPVYFVGDTPAGPRLYREFRRVPAASPFTEALTLAASGEPDDPDYRTLLPAGTFDTSDSAGNGAAAGAWVDLPDDSWTRRPAGMTDREALLAIQQLVYTAQGVLQQRVPIHFTDSHGDETQILGIASEDGFTAAPPLRTLALVNITQPSEGQPVTGALTASGVASSFEANVPWEVRDSSGAVVLKGAATAEGWMDKLYPWEADIPVSRLAPGSYTFTARTDDPSDGEGPGPTEDTRTIVVQ